MKRVFRRLSGEGGDQGLAAATTVIVAGEMIEPGQHLGHDGVAGRRSVVE